MSKNKSNRTQKAATSRHPAELGQKMIERDLVAQVKELSEENKRIQQDYDDLKQRHEALVRDLEEAADSEEQQTRKPDPSRLVRGKLPGEKLIAVDTETGKFAEVTREEWDAIPR